LLALYFAMLLMLRVLVLGTGQLELRQDWQFALAVIVPLGSTVMYLLAVFSFGLSGDLAARESIYPSRLFTRPLTSSALAGWPMFYGSLAITMLWILTRSLAVWPSEARVPLIWPSLFGVAILAWTQALTWMPYPLRGLRVVVTVSWLATVSFVVLTALQFRPSEATMIVLLAPHLPLAYLTARRALTRARCGDVPDRLSLSFRPLRSRPRTWSSPGAAQRWLEWQRHGRSLPTLVLMVVPLELCLLVFFRETPRLILGTVSVVLLTPVLLATFVAATVRTNADARDTYELTPFLAVRPQTTADLLRAKLTATLLSTVVTWLVVAGLLLIALPLTGTWAEVARAGRQLTDFAGPQRALLLTVMGLAGLIGATWKQLVQSLYIGLSGRRWLAKASVFATLVLLTIAVPLASWTLERQNALSALWNAAPWILTLLVSAKMVAAGWIVGRLQGEELVEDRTLVLGALTWCLSVLGLYRVLDWLFPVVLFRSHFLLLTAILAIPLVRLSAAPLALAWNRHR
ncbi:MAG: hypothetical protein AAGA81_07780, partial [Acidobacteriota bacterium]